jgi:hypothetical protein
VAAHISLLAIVTLFVLVGLIMVGVLGQSSSQRSSAKKRSQPYEFMYLDSARVNSYLGQLDGGDIQGENRQEITNRDANVGLELNTVGKATARTSSQLTRNVVVNQSEADKFYELLNELEDRKSLKKLTADNSLENKLNKDQPLGGGMILIEGVLLEMPPYLSAYPELRYANFRTELEPTKKKPECGKNSGDPGRRQPLAKKRPKLLNEAFEPVPLSQFRAVDESIRGTPKREREAFKRRAGANPRIPFSFSIDVCHRKAKTGTRVTIVVPARFADITGDPELLNVPLTIAGKVVSDIKEERASDGTQKKFFGDGLSVSTYWPALSAAKAPFLGELGVRKEYLRLPRRELRERLFEALEHSLTFTGHVVVVVPVAIYD